MSFEKKGNDLGLKLRRVLPEYPPISEAKNSCTELKGFWDLQTMLERDKFENRWLEEESHKLYKAIDSAGFVFLMRNPAVARHSLRIGNKPITYVRRPMGHVDGLSVTTSPIPTRNGNDAPTGLWGGIPLGR